MPKKMKCSPKLMQVALMERPSKKYFIFHNWLEHRTWLLSFQILSFVSISFNNKDTRTLALSIQWHVLIDQFDDWASTKCCPDKIRKYYKILQVVEHVEHLKINGTSVTTMYAMEGVTTWVKFRSIEVLKSLGVWHKDTCMLCLYKGFARKNEFWMRFT